MGLLLSFKIEAAAPLTFSEPELAATGPVSAKTPNRLTRLQAERHSIEYSALLAWAEATQREAMAEGPNTLAFMLANPSIACAREHRARRNMVTLGQAAPPPSWMKFVLDCATQDFSQQTARVIPQWDSMTTEERTARANLALLQLWNAIDPAVHVQALIVFEQQIKPDRVDEPAFGQFAEAYAHCTRTTHEAAARMAAPEATAADVAADWLAQAQTMTGCASDVTLERFPIPTEEPLEKPP